MAQKLSICLGFFTQPSVLLLDEPFIGLDPHAIKELKEAIVELRCEGATLLVSTHVLALLVFLAIVFALYLFGVVVFAFAVHERQISPDGVSMRTACSSWGCWYLWG